MKYYAYVRNMEYATFCKEREGPYDRDECMKEFLRTVGTSAVCTDLQPYYKESDMFWCFVEIKNGWTVRLVSGL